MTPQAAALVLEHESLVRIAARRLVPRLVPGRIDAADVVQCGRLGLCEAALRWEPSRGVPFSAYARLRIHGAMVDAIRQVGEFGPTRRWSAPPLGLDEAVWLPAPAVDIERQASGRELLTRAVALRNRRERFVLLAWAHSATDQAISARLGLTPSRVSQIRHVALQRLREQVEA